MKRFKIKNKANGLQFIQAGLELQMCPEYGQPQRWVNGSELTEEEKAQALESKVEQGPDGESVTFYKLAAEFEIVEEDMTAEIAAKEADEEERRQARDFLKGLKKSDLNTVDKCATAIMRIVKHLRADK